MRRLLLLLWLGAGTCYADCFCSQASGEIIYSDAGLSTGTTNFTYDPAAQTETVYAKDGDGTSDFSSTAHRQYGATEYRAVAGRQGPPFGTALAGRTFRDVSTEAFSGGLALVERTPSFIEEWTADGGLHWGYGMAYNGNVWVGDPGASARSTFVPTARLEVLGDIAMPVQGNGLILKAIDGANCYRLRVANNGSLNTSLIACPPTS